MSMSPEQDQSDTESGETADPQGGDDSQDAGFCIEIRVKADGSISVGVESLAEETSEEGGEDGGESDDGYIPAKNVKDALTKALEIYRSGGQQPGQADDSFQQGFSSSGGGY